MGDLQTTAHPIGCCQLLVRYEYRIEQFAYARRKRRAAPRLKADVHAQAFVSCNKPVVISMSHRVQVVDPLVVHVQQLRCHPQRFAFKNFAQVIDVHAEREDRVVLPVRVVEPEPPVLVHRIRGDIESQNVVGHVHVPVMINPLGQDGECRLR